MGACVSADSGSDQLKYEFLMNTPLFLHLDTPQLQQFAKRFQLMKYERHQLIVQENTQVDSLYVICQGSVVYEAEGDVAGITSSMVVRPRRVNSPKSTSSPTQTMLPGSHSHLKEGSQSSIKEPIQNGHRDSMNIVLSPASPTEAVRRLSSKIESTEGSRGEGGSGSFDGKKMDSIVVPGAVNTVHTRASNNATNLCVPGGTESVSARMQNRRHSVMATRKTVECSGTVLTVKSDGAIFGNIGFLKNSARWQVSIVAGSRCILMSITKPAFLSFIKKYPATKEPLLAALGDTVEKHLTQLPLFRGVPANRIELLASMLHYVTLQPDEILFRDGDLDEEGNSLFIVYNGCAKAVAIDAEGKEKVLNVFHTGDFFGEIGLLVDIPRTATIVAMQKCLLFELAKADFQSFLKINTSPQLEQNLNEMMKLRTAEHFRKYNVPFFSAIPDEKYCNLAAICTIKQVPKGTVIFKEGDMGDCFYLIAHGACAVSCHKTKKGGGDGETETIELCQLGPGNYFGEAALLRATQRNATVATLTRSVLLSIDIEGFRKFFEQVPEAFADFEVRLAKYDVTLRTVLHHSAGKKVFAEHLRREFSSENMEFWEAIQEYQRRFRHLEDETSDNSRRTPDAQGRLSPRSSTEWRQDDSYQRNVQAVKSLTSHLAIASRGLEFSASNDRESMMVEATRIVQEFVASGAPKEVNISAELKKALVELVHEHKFRITPCSFQSAQANIFDLMQTDSFPRFKQSDLFHQFLQQLDRPEEPEPKTDSPRPSISPRKPSESSSRLLGRTTSQRKKLASLVDVQKRVSVRQLDSPDTPSSPVVRDIPSDRRSGGAKALENYADGDDLTSQSAKRRASRASRTSRVLEPLDSAAAADEDLINALKAKRRTSYQKVLDNKDAVIEGRMKAEDLTIDSSFVAALLSPRRRASLERDNEISQAKQRRIDAA